MNSTPSTNDAAARAGDVPVARRHLGLVLAVGAAVTALDQATKTWAAKVLVTDPIEILGGRLWLHTTRNSGAAFNLATGLTPLLSLIAAAVVITVVVLARRPTRARHALILGLFLGGAAGNLSDRLLRPPGPLRGHVVDWIDFRVWPSFNLADSSLVTASVMLVVFTVLTSRTSAHALATPSNNAPPNEPRDSLSTPPRP